MCPSPRYTHGNVLYSTKSEESNVAIVESKKVREVVAEEV